MKHATLDLKLELFVEFSKASSSQNRGARKFIVKENPLPRDAKVVGLRLADNGRWPQTLQLVLESAEFADIPDGESLPALPLVVYETIFEQ